MLFNGSMMGNDSCQSPQRMLFFDTETYRKAADIGRMEVTLPLRLGCWKAGRPENGKLTRVHKDSFTTISQFWQAVWSQCSKRQTLWLVAHNAAFDLSVLHFWELWENKIVSADIPNTPRDKQSKIEESWYKGGLMVIDNPPFILTMKHNASGGRIVIVDSFNFFRCSLAKMGEACGLEKMPMPRADAPNGEWLEYCWRDVDILAETFAKFVHWVKESDLGCMKYTGAMQAMAAYRHRFMPLSTEYEYDRNGEGRTGKRKRRIGLINFGHDGEVKAFERKAYFGGQVELYRIGKIDQECFCLDVSSLYPSSMIGNKFPYRLKAFNLDTSPLTDKPGVDPSCSVARVFLSTGKDTFPVRVKSGVCYCSGTFWTTLAGPELQYAESMGYVRQYSQWAEYHCTDLFTNYVTALWKMRKAYIAEDNQLYADFVKLLMNSLHGKFGQRSPEWIDCPERIALAPWAKWARIDLSCGVETVYRSLGWLVQKQVEREETARSFPAISAFVTSYARLAMRRLMSIAEKPNVFSLSTDCIWTNQEGYSNLCEAGEVSNLELGKLRLQYSSTEVEFIAANCYRVGNILKVAGLKGGSKQVASHVYSEEQFTTTGGLFRGITPGEPTVTRITKHLPSTYNKGQVLPSGEVVPFELSQSPN